MKLSLVTKVYFVAKVLLTMLMMLSAGMYIFTPDPMKFIDLGYPAYLMYPLAGAKILGVLAIWFSRSETLKTWAYAGFFFDMVLAFSAHIYVQDGEWPPAFLGLLFVSGAVIFEAEMKKNQIAQSVS